MEQEVVEALNETHTTISEGNDEVYAPFLSSSHGTDAVTHLFTR
jgi:hypothetical protein